MASRPPLHRLEIDSAASNEPALICRAGEIGHSYHYWRGASGRRYLHTVFRLLECPEIPKASYIIVACGPDGDRQALEIGQTFHNAASINRAELRQRAAKLGASEIHLHLLADTPSGRSSVVTDLRARHQPMAGGLAEVAKAS